jgi:hypothetical protein
MPDLSYDPTEYGSPEEYARSRANMDREFAMPRKPYTGAVGRLVNAHHARFEAAMNDDFGWGGTTPEQLARKWHL